MHLFVLLGSVAGAAHLIIFGDGLGTADRCR